MTPELNSFSKFTLSSSEQRYAVDFNTLNRTFLQNLLADSAEEKILLQYDPLNPTLVVQQEAYLRGKIDILKYILSLKPEHFADDETEIVGE